MRSGVVILLCVITACGGKTMLFDEDNPGASGTTTTPTTGPSATTKPPPAQKPKLVPKPDPPRDGCAQPVPWTQDFGELDVSRLGCECFSHDDCMRGELCMTFPSIETAHCAATDDPCSLVRCRGTATCVVGDADPMIPQCYR